MQRTLYQHQDSCIYYVVQFNLVKQHAGIQGFNQHTVEPVLKDHPIGHTNVVSQDRWSLVTGLITLKCRTFCQEYLVSQDRWSLMAVVSQDRFVSPTVLS